MVSKEECVARGIVCYGWSLNGPRRHLTTGQKALFGARIFPEFEARAKERQSVGRPKKDEKLLKMFSEDSGTARDQAARMVGVSGPSIDKARQLLEELESLPDDLYVGFRLK